MRLSENPPTQPGDPKTASPSREKHTKRLVGEAQKHGKMKKETRNTETQEREKQKRNKTTTKKQETKHINWGLPQDRGSPAAAFGPLGPLQLRRRAAGLAAVAAGGLRPRAQGALEAAGGGCGSKKSGCVVWLLETWTIIDQNLRFAPPGEF